MVISLPPEVELLVKRQVENGTYGSIEDVVMAGLSHILGQDDLEAEMSHDRLKQDVLIGLEQADQNLELFVSTKPRIRASRFQSGYNPFVTRRRSQSSKSV